MTGLSGRLLVAWLWLAFLSPAAFAHPLDPALLEIRESADGTLDVLWRFPLARNADTPLRAVLPDDCRPLSEPTVERSEARVAARWQARCDGGSLEGRAFGVVGLRERQTDALLRVHLADGRLIQQVLRGDTPVLAIPERDGRLGVLRDYVRLGFEHILGGPDHLLFVLGLVLLVKSWGRLLWTITAFTGGHSVTLSLAVLGIVHVPPQPVEALIALTIVLVAADLVRHGPRRETWMQRFPWAMAFTFGLLHGLGFAGALAEIGLPAEEIPLALFAFNLGIEAGQLLWVAAILAARVGLSALPLRWPRPAALIPAYVIGSLGAYWMTERTVSLVWHP